MGENKHQKFVAQVLGTRLISYNPDLAKMLGSAKAGLFFNQLLYWWKKGSNPEEIYKTIKEIEEETGLSRTEQDTAIRICKSHGILSAIRKGIPAKRHFQINIPKVVSLLESSLSKTDKQVCKRSTKHIAGNRQSNTENTPEINNRNLVLQTRQIKDLPINYFLKNKINAYKNDERWGEKPTYRGDRMVWVPGKKKLYVIDKYGLWLEFVGKESEIEWK